MIVLLAGYRERAKDFAHEHRLHSKEWKWPKSALDIKGLKGDTHFMYLPCFMSHPHASEIDKAINWHKYKFNNPPTMKEANQNGY